MVSGLPALTDLETVLRRIREITSLITPARETALPRPSFAERLAARAAPRGKPTPPEASVTDLVREYAGRFDLPPEIVIAVIEAESGGNPRAVSRAGAMGLMQLMPDTARSLGVANPFEPAQNVEGGCHYLKEMFTRFHSWPLALAAYNAGPGAVARYGGVPPYPETRRYVSRVLARARELWEGGLW